MHHVRITLDEHEVFYLYGTVLADTSEIIAAEIHEHHMFSTFLFVFSQLLFPSPVFLRISTARTRSRNGTVLELLATHTYEHLRRGPQHLEIARLQEIQIRGWINHAQCAIDLERRHTGFKFHALREHDLEGISGANVFLGFQNALKERTSQGSFFEL